MKEVTVLLVNCPTLGINLSLPPWPCYSTRATEPGLVSFTKNTSAAKLQAGFFPLNFYQV